MTSTIRERLRELADDVRWDGARDPSNYWRGFNDGLDRLTGDTAFLEALDTLERRAAAAEKELRAYKRSARKFTDEARPLITEAP